MELVNEWLPTGKFRKVDTPFCTDYTYENELMAVVTSIGNNPHMEKMEYPGKLGHTIGHIQHTDIMRIFDIFYKAFLLVTQNMAPTTNGFQGLNKCIQYMANYSYKPVFYPYNSYDIPNIIISSWGGTQVEDYTTHNCL